MFRLILRTLFSLTACHLVSGQSTTDEQFDYFTTLLEEQNQVIERLNAEINRQKLVIQDLGSKAEDQGVRPSVIHIIRGNHAVTSLTSFNNQLFVARQMGQISVYNTSTFELIRRIEVPGAGDRLFGMIPCPYADCLYVSDYSNHKLLQITIYFTPFSSVITTATNWSVIVDRPTGLSINRINNILVSSWSLIQEYSSNGSFVREMSADSLASCHPYQAVQLHNRNLVASFTCSAQLSGVCLLSRDGQVLNCYGNVPEGSVPLQVSNPRGVAVDKHGFVLVADKGNDRVLVLDPTLTDACILPLFVNSTERLNQPRSLWFDESRGRLYVGESSSPYRVLVFDNVVDFDECIRLEKQSNP